MSYWSFSALNQSRPKNSDGLSILPVIYAANELSAFYTDLFQLPINTDVLPDSWRSTRIAPLPQNSSPAASLKMLSIACSPVPLKVIESLMLNTIGSITTWPRDPQKFVYKANRRTPDVLSCLSLSRYQYIHRLKRVAKSSKPSSMIPARH